MPKVIGGSGFIVSSTLIMLEVQERWYKPNLRSLGWHIGIWNLIGAIGFTLCGALGFASDNEGAEYASTLSTFIGSWAFLVRRREKGQRRGSRFHVPPSAVSSQSTLMDGVLCR